MHQLPIFSLRHPGGLHEEGAGVSGRRPERAAGVPHRDGQDAVAAVLHAGLAGEGEGRGAGGQAAELQQQRRRRRAGRGEPRAHGPAQGHLLQQDPLPAEPGRGGAGQDKLQVHS